MLSRVRIPTAGALLLFGALVACSPSGPHRGIKDSKNGSSDVNSASATPVRRAGDARVRRDDGGECYDATSGQMDALKLGRIAESPARVNFLENRSDEHPSCPSGTACRKRAFVTAGDVVLMKEAAGGFVCASYKSPKGVATDGFLPAHAVQPVPARPPALGEFAGEWRRDNEAKIVIRTAGQQLAVQGDATYGAEDPDRVRRGAVNMGELKGTATPRGDVLPLGVGYDGAKAPSEVRTDECLARLRLLGRYLVVEDNNACGGFNVSFNGVYVRPGR